MKKLYTVELNEIHCATFEVEATSEQDAVNEVLGGAGDLVHSEYSYTPDNDAVRSVTKIESICHTGGKFLKED